MKYHAIPGFTLAELLISLAIIGVIATFTIPKIIAAQTNYKYNSMAKEAAGFLSDALNKYKTANGIVPSVSMDYDLFQYINYVKYDTNSQMDERPGTSGPITCASGAPCIRLHNGTLIESTGQAWYNTNTTDAVYFHFDPDGVYDNNNDSVVFALYVDGTVRSRDTLKSNTEFPGGAIRGPGSGNDPSWFNW